MSSDLSPLSLESLPGEIIEEILFHIADIRSLYHLIQASPKTSRVFRHIGPNALDHVLSKSAAPELIEAMRLVGAVRTSCPSSPFAPSLEILLNSYVRGHMPTMTRAVTKYSKTPDVKPLKIIYAGQEPSARELLVIARDTAQLATSCLARCREHLLAAKPAHISEHGFYYRQMPWRERPKGVPYRFAKLGPVSWPEEQRIMCDFWRVQFFYDLQNAALQGRLGWADGDINNIRYMAVEEFYRHYKNPEQGLLTAVDFVRLLRANSIARSGIPLAAPMALPGLGPDSPRTLWPECSTIRQFAGIDDQDGWHWLNVVTQDPTSPIYGVPMRAFRDLGMALWDWETLEDLEMKMKSVSKAPGWPRTASGKVGSVNPGVFYTWRSLLSDEVLTELESRLEEKWQANNHDTVLAGN